MSQFDKTTLFVRIVFDRANLLTRSPTDPTERARFIRRWTSAVRRSVRECFAAAARALPVVLRSARSIQPERHPVRNATRDRPSVLSRRIEAPLRETFGSGA